MDACCLNGATQYINKDGTIDNAAVTVARQEFIDWARNEKRTERWIARNLLNIGTCKCMCHVKGSCILH